MLEDFTLCISTKFIFGRDAQHRVGTELSSAGIRKVLIHHDGGAYLSATGLLPSLKQDLENAGISYVELGGVRPNPRLTLVREGIALARSEGVDAVVAVGGGSVIDSSKAIGLGAVAECDVWDLFTGAQAPARTLPVAAIVTNPASGSESSQVVVVNNAEESSKLLISDPVCRPAFAFMNPELTVSLPAFPTACGIVDMFSHVCERYFAPDTDFGVIDSMAEGALRALVAVAPLLMNDLTNYGYRAQIMWTGTIAQNNTLGVGREQDWATHALGNELSALYDTPHGATLSIVMGAWMEAACADNPERFARFGREVFGVSDDGDALDVARRGIEATVAFFESLGMPTSFADMDIPSDGVETMLDNIEFFGPDEAIGSISRLGREECRWIYTRSF
ncbi:iron-containing alcohol dehydrogenase [Actinomycetaceae bacterium L2_0104]